LSVPLNSSRHLLSPHPKPRSYWLTPRAQCCGTSSHHRGKVRHDVRGLRLVPCINPSLCRACRDADARKARGESPRYIQASRWHRTPDHFPVDWESKSIEALIAHFDRTRRRHGAPQPTVEALMYSLRERGTKALEEPATERRLSELGDDQVIEVGDRLQKLKPEIARAWSTEEVKFLLRARIK
jgi:hypothetical protein